MALNLAFFSIRALLYSIHKYNIISFISHTLCFSGYFIEVIGEGVKWHGRWTTVSRHHGSTDEAIWFEYWSVNHTYTIICMSSYSIYLICTPMDRLKSKCLTCIHICATSLPSTPGPITKRSWEATWLSPCVFLEELQLVDDRLLMGRQPGNRFLTPGFADIAAGKRVEINEMSCHEFESQLCYDEQQSLKWMSEGRNIVGQWTRLILRRCCKIFESEK